MKQFLDEYIKRKDAERALLERCKETGYGGLTPDDIRLVMRTPWRIPTADVVEVVRCKDCKFFEPDTFGDCWCSAKSPGVSKGMFSPSGDSYCSDAVKRGEDDG